MIKGLCPIVISEENTLESETDLLTQEGGGKSLFLLEFHFLFERNPCLFKF